MLHFSERPMPLRASPAPDTALRFLWLRAALGLLLTTSASGCGDSFNRHTVSGQISLNGVPVEQGDISFTPVDETSFGGGAMIVKGSYETAPEKGLPPGKYVVRISSSVVEPGT